MQYARLQILETINFLSGIRYLASHFNKQFKNYLDKK